MLVSTPSIILQVFPYGDTSRIARLATADLGVQSVIAKGAMRPRSRFGGRLQVLSAGVAHFHHRATRDLQTLTGFDVTDQHVGLAHDLRRFAAAAALAELVLRSAREEPQPAVFAVLSETLDALATISSDREPDVALAGLWQAIVALGFAPTVDRCVRCGGALGGRAWFALSEGGLLCERCGQGMGTGALQAGDQEALRAFLEGTTDGVTLPARHMAAHRRLVARFIRRHIAEEAALPALAFWETIG